MEDELRKIIDGLMPILALMKLVEGSLLRGVDVLVTIQRADEGHVGRLKLPDGWEDVICERKV